MLKSQKNKRQRDKAEVIAQKRGTNARDAKY